MNSRAWMIRILAALLAVGIGLSLADAYRTRDWWGALTNLGPELIGAVVTYWLFEVFLRRRMQEDKDRAQRDLMRFIDWNGSDSRPSDDPDSPAHQEEEG